MYICFGLCLGCVSLGLCGMGMLSQGNIVCVYVYFVLYLGYVSPRLCSVDMFGLG